MKRILINATQREELRVAIVDGQQLFDLDIDTASHEQRKSNLYKGRITRVEPSLEACFVDYGAERHGFLPLKEIAPEYLNADTEADQHDTRARISEGHEVVVQVEKDERGNKGAALTTFASLAGRFLVLMPNSPKAGGVTRRVDGAQREEAKKTLAELQIPEEMGVIIRTNGVGRSVEELQWDLDHLVTIWKAVSDAAAARPAPFLIYQENNIVLRALRDYLRPDIGEVIVDSAEIYEQAHAQMTYTMPRELPKLKFYRDNIPLFSRYQIESQIETAHQRLVRLPSGGSIVIDRTEALTAIDVNSAKSTGSTGIEETAYRTNLEAADEVARQLRLRDLGGLIVVDFIDMGPSRNQRDVEHHLAQACAIDRARVQIGHLSRFGLLELSRQRLRPSLGEHSQITCPRCEGRGQIRSIESLSLSILRLIEEECMKDRTSGVIAQLPVDVATFLLNEKRATVNELADRYNEFVTLIPNETLRSPHFEIQRVRSDHRGEPEVTGLSYALAQDFGAEARAKRAEIHTAGKPPEPAVSAVLPDAPLPLPLDAPDPAPAAAPVTVVQAPPNVPASFWQRLMAVFNPPQATAAPPAMAPEAPEERHRRAGASRRTGRSGTPRAPDASRGRNASTHEHHNRGGSAEGRSTDGQNRHRGNSRRAGSAQDGSGSPRARRRGGTTRTATNGQNGSSAGADADPQRTPRPPATGGAVETVDKPAAPATTDTASASPASSETQQAGPGQSAA
ncbi:MAG TPA: Rne/Rng family ribonuclease, partial [Nevskiaceae bacterium]